MNPTRFSRNVSTAAVASIAAWSSWSHMVHVALYFGERPEVAYVLPISVDGMLIVASTAMVDDKRVGRDVRWSARIAFVAGVGASVAANIAAAQPTLGARIVAAWPAVALMLVVEMLSRTRRTPPAVMPDADVREPARADAPGPEPADKEHAGLRELLSAGSDFDADVPAIAVDDRLHVQADPRRHQHPPVQRRRNVGHTAQQIAKIRAEQPAVSVADLAALVGVSERHVRRILASGS
jgi:hypothetical protein